MKKNGDGWTSSARIDSGFTDTVSKKLVGKMVQKKGSPQVYW